MHKVKIKVDAAGNGTVVLDGKTVDTVAVGFNAGAGETTEVTLVLHADVELDAETDDLTMIGEKRL